MENSVDSVLLDVDGKRLMCEALYLLGVILIFMDLKVGHACCDTRAVTRVQEHAVERLHVSVRCHGQACS